MAVKTITKKGIIHKTSVASTRRKSSTHVRIREIAGCLSNDEAEEMKKRIEDAFEVIDPNAW